MEPVPLVATVAAGAFAVAAFATLSMQRFILSGTLFMFTAISIYIREITREA